MVEERKEGRSAAASQLTLDNYDEAEDSDPQYGHLTAHLVESAPQKKDTAMWTRVFTRDEVADLQISAHTLGPDLLYDRSLREATQHTEDLPGEVVFSPMLFRKEDLRRELSDSEIPLPSLLGLGEVATKAKQRFVGMSSEAPADSNDDGRGPG